MNDVRTPQTAASEPPAGHKLTDPEWFALRALADVVIPPSAAHGVPGAGDEAICKNVIKDTGARLARLKTALATLDEMASKETGKTFPELSPAERERVALAFQSAHTGPARMIEALVSQCYYRDDRVLVSLGMEARPPFPQGYAVDEGDWSVLDPVRKRAPFHRSPT